jgi:hypothetical protein
VLEPDSFLIKGEDTPPHAHWAGNPATEVGARHRRLVPPDDHRKAWLHPVEQP